jgi:hypothetical protein
MTARLLSRPELLREVFPELVEPVKEALAYCGGIEGRELGPAPAVDELDVHGFCGCGDDFCGTFSTTRPPEQRRGWTDHPIGPLDHVADAPSIAGSKRRYDSAMARPMP